MPLALVFTSAPRGLTSGRSGYVTVARHREMPDRLVEQLEQLGTPHERTDGATVSCRALEAGGRRWVVLSRFTAGGLDHTRRDNRLAHHLAFAPEELAALPPPADIARRFAGWRDRWEAEPAWLEPEPLRLDAGRPLIPCARWRELAGSGAKAAWLVDGASPAPRTLSGPLGAEDWLRLLAEASALLGPSAGAASFTTDADVTGAAGFTWRCQSHGGELDLSRPEGIPTPEGAIARQAALGVSAPPPPGSRPAAPSPATTAEGSGGLPGWAWVAGVAGLVAIGGLAVWLLRPAEAPPVPVATATPRQPTPDELAAAQRLLRDQAALGEIASATASGDLAQAARLWLELERLAPEVAGRNTEPTLSRIRARFATAVADRLEAELDRPETARDNRRALEARDAAAADLRTGAAVGAPRDAAWSRLEEAAARAALLASLDVRPTLVVTGKWATAGAGPKVPLAAEFDLGEEAGKAVREFLGSGLVGNSGRGSLRLGAIAHLGHRDPAAKAVAATIELGQTSVWIAAAAPDGTAVEVNVGARVNAVSLRLAVGDGGRLSAPIAVDLTNAAGKRLALALVPEGGRLGALRLPRSALRPEPVTRAIAAAGWIEPLLGDARHAGARIGLYPAGHVFPDRAIPSPVATPNQVDTNLLRLAAGQGSMPRAEILARQKASQDGDALGAGSPWTLRAVRLDGTPVATLAEFAER